MKQVNLSKKYFVLTPLLLCGLLSLLQAQPLSNWSARQVLYADFASRGAFYSINYDRVFHEGAKNNLSFRAGFSLLKDVIAFPIGINLVTGKENHHAEFSFTLIPHIDQYRTLFNANGNSDKFLYVVPAAGYRFQKPGGGFFLKAALSPMIVLDPPSDDFWNMDPKLYAAGNLGLGYSF